MKMKILSWNVNGIRAVERKGALKTLIEAEKPDILCVQETKIGLPSTRGLPIFGPEYDVEIPGYVGDLNMGRKAGYAGTAIYVREEVAKEYKLLGKNRRFVVQPMTVAPDEEDADISDKYGDPDADGRISMIELPKFYLVTVYTPNSKDDLSRLELREKKWDPLFLREMKELEKKKPVVICGDFNAAHEEIDIARPENNHNHAGFTDEERKGITEIIKAGFLDSFRKMHPKTVKYSWWSYRGRARENNVGWRIDYFFVSSEIFHALSSAEILDQYMGSDHCPIMIEIEA